MQGELNKETYSVQGMHCAACAMTVQKAIESQDGVLEVTVNYASNAASITRDRSRISFDEISEAVRNSGYQLLEQKPTLGNLDKAFEVLRKEFFIALAFSSVVFALSMFVGDFQFKNWLLLVLSIPVIFWSGRHFYVRAWKQLKRWTTSMDTLIAFGTGSAFLFSLLNTIYPDILENRGIVPHVYYESAVVIITFILLGKLLEEKAKNNTSRAIEKLYSLQVDQVIRLKEDGNQEVIQLSEVKIGNSIIVRPGDKIPVDGTVIKGTSNVDESLVTGESKSVAKEKRSSVVAGSLNLDGSLEVFVTKVGDDTHLGRIIQLVSDAQASKAPMQKLADKIASVFVPIVILLALVTFLVWIAYGPQPAVMYAFINTFSVLIIACPCALGLATPMAIMAGIGRGAKMGLLIKDAVALEKASRVEMLFLDKTGTISEGKMTVQHLKSYFPEDENLLNLSILAGIEGLSSHPIAQAVHNHLKSNYSLIPFSIEKTNVLPGVGVESQIDGQTYRVMGEQGLDLLKIGEDQKRDINSALDKGVSIVTFSRGAELLVLMELEDTIRSGSAEFINSIQKKGIEVIMLSGDNKAVCAQVAYELGLENYRAGLLPEDKLRIVGESQTNGKMVAFAGDGINDAPALAKADVSIAMSSGTESASESAQITLLKGDLRKLLGLLRLSSKTSLIMRQNLFWAFIYNIIAIPIAAGVLFPMNGFLLNPMIAGAAMALSSLSVVVNSLRLRTIKI